jgi:Protein of unknown function (DUF1232)
VPGGGFRGRRGTRRSRRGPHGWPLTAALPRRGRVGLVLLLAYLPFPFDLVPDFIPVLGYADDAIIVAAVLRWAVRQAGIEAIRRQWPGAATASPPCAVSLA